MSDALTELPPEVRALLADHAEENESVLAAIGTQIAAKREEAKAARASSGIESTWKDCEESYLGIDDANRHEFADARWAKPMSMDGPVTSGRTLRATDHKSTVFYRLTSRYVDAGVAKLTEILLPADEKAFSFSEMPVPEHIAASEDESQVVHSDLGVPLTRPPAPGEVPPVAPAMMPPVGAGPPGATATAGQSSPAQPAGPPPAPPQPPRVALTVKDLAVEAIELARKKAKAAETRIYDWMVATQYRAEIRKVIADQARIGVGIFEAPTPVSKRVMAVLQKGDGIELVIKQKIIPAGKWVDPWDIFPDPACGELICDGDFVFKRDHMSGRQVRGLKKLPGYIGSQIDKVLEEGPKKANSDGGGRRPGADKTKDRYEVWYFFGTLTKNEMAAIDAACGKTPATGDDDGPDEAHAIVTLINDSVVRATINPLDSGSFPYHSVPWQRRAGHWAGVGVAEQMRAPQRVTNAALRALLNNAGKSAGSQFVINMAAIRPADGTWAITPDKIWEKTMDGSNDIRQDFLAIPIPNVTQPLMEIITLGEKMAEETTSIPLISQGQSGATTPDTLGATQLQDNNANQLLRSIGYIWDDHITEPVVRQYYEWLLLDPSVPNEEKGEFEINAHGSAALVERAIQHQFIAQIVNSSLNPAFGLDPKKAMAELVKANKINPEALQYSKEDQAKMDAAPPPEQPAVQVAKINADTQLKLGVMKQTTDQQTVQHEGQIAAAAHVLEVGKVQVDQQATHLDATIEAHKVQLQHEQALMAYAVQQKISLDTAKMQLAKTAMSLQVEQSLNAANNSHDMRKHRTPQPPRPAVQVPGRAGNGRAASQAPAQ
jgi:hypothetical protein